jgi:hypothetical protein
LAGLQAIHAYKKGSRINGDNEKKNQARRRKRETRAEEEAAVTKQLKCIAKAARRGHSGGRQHVYIYLMYKVTH